MIVYPVVFLAAILMIFINISLLLFAPQHKGPKTDNAKTLPLAQYNPESALSGLKKAKEDMNVTESEFITLQKGTSHELN